MTNNKKYNSMKKMTLRCNHPHRIKRLRKLIHQACEHVAREYNSTQVLLNWMINGLAALIVAQYEMVPNHGSVYILYNRAADRVKCLFWDKNGVDIRTSTITNKPKFKPHQILRV